MAISEAFANTATISTTEWSLPRNAAYSSASPQTTAGIYQVYIDVSALAGADEFAIRIYEKVLSSGTQRELLQANLAGAQVQPWVSPSLILMNGWDVTIDKITGTDRSISWSIRLIA